eukprot:s1424_g5.t2
MATVPMLEEDTLDMAAFPCYGGDQFPRHWSEERRLKAEKHYKAVPEEFCTKKLRMHAWEWFSGSGRLSSCLLMANMLVRPPTDYRYGWDIGHAPHQALLQRCHEAFAPAHLFSSPSWNSWTTSTAPKDLGIREIERRQELPALQYLSEICLAQHQLDRGFAVEQPAGSSMAKESPLSHLSDHSGVRTSRFDQCMFGAQDEAQAPLRKATCLLSIRWWHKVMKRCGGHHGKAHGQLQGRFRGCSRASMATVFPKRLCLAMSQDMWSSFRQHGDVGLMPWPSFLTGMVGVFYSCERCQLGRAAPPGCEHTMVPGECRYGQPSMRAARSRQTVAPAPSRTAAPPSPRPPSTSGSPAASSSAAPPLARDGLEDITGPFKFLARSGDYSRVSLEVHASLVLDIESRLYLKAALLQLIESCLDLFAVNTEETMRHWLSDPILIRVFQDVFSSIMNVLGVLVTLRPWNKQVPDPHLSSAVAPMRLLVFGSLRSWTVGPLEDMRVLIMMLIVLYLQALLQIYFLRPPGLLLL